MPQPREADEIAVGSSYHFTLSTHCGVEFLVLDGDLWQAETPLGEGNTPPGWRWLQAGVIEVTSEDRAVFSDSTGHQVTFLRRPQHEPIGCA